MEAPKKPVRPSSAEALDRLISDVLVLKRICKADAGFFEEFREYCASEEKRFETVFARAKLGTSLELCQEALNLRRRLTVMKLLLQLMG